ncbi:MAG: acetylornithine transaminase [Rickettsiales bacterium]|nr:acetylornithine transaminase [Rickettsiales bacterium]
MTITPYMPVYRRADVTITRGEGCYLYDTTGKRYLDCAAGIAVNALGHGHPRVVEALKKQADELWHCSNLFNHEGLQRYAQRLVRLSFADTAFFCSSGTEAVEAAIKFVRRAHYSAGNTKRYRIITMTMGFHGRTLGALSAADDRAFSEGFEPLLDGFDRATFNDLESVKAQITDETAAIMLEPIQGEGGVNTASKAFMQGVRRLCDEHGLLLFLDEIQCGMARPGALFAYEAYGVEPDLITIAKGMGNGFPLAGVLMREAIGHALPAGSHGSTYGSNPLAMAVGNAVLDELERPEFLKAVRSKGDYFTKALNRLVGEHPSVFKEVRGMGLMLGLAMRIPARDFAAKLREAGLLVAPCYGDVLRIIPPLVITESEMDEAVDILNRIAKDYA